MNDLTSMKEDQQTRTAKVYKQWILAAAMGLLVSISFYALLTTVTVYASISFDVNFWVHPRLFFEGFQGNASLLFASLSAYLGFSFFLFVSRRMRFKDRVYWQRRKKRLGSTEFQGRAWTTVYMVLALSSFFFLGFAFEDFHIPIATEPAFAYFVKLLASFIFLDILFTFYRAVLAQLRTTLLLGLAVLTLAGGLISFSGAIWARGKAVVASHREDVFRKQIDLPVSTYNSAKRGVYNRSGNPAIVLDAGGTAKVYTESGSFAVEELYQWFSSSCHSYFNTRAKRVVRVYADRNLPMERMYQLDAQTACIERRTFHYMAWPKEGPEQEWWENHSDHYISLSLLPADCALLPPVPPFPEFFVEDTLFISQEGIRYKERRLNDAGLQEVLKDIIRAKGITPVYFEKGSTYGQYIKVIGMVFETAHGIRDDYALARFGAVCEDLETSEEVKEAKDRYPIRLLDLSRIAYHKTH